MGNSLASEQAARHARKVHKAHLIDRTLAVVCGVSITLLLAIVAFLCWLFQFLVKSPDKTSYYTYLLIDPRDGIVFYVGKGRGDRMNIHVREASAGNPTCNLRKYMKIREIMRSGGQVIVRTFSRHAHEEEAYGAEDVLLTAMTGETLTNIKGSRALEREEWATLMLGCLKSFDRWIATMGTDVAKCFKEENPRDFYDRFVAAVKAEGRRIGGNTYCANR